MNKLSFGDRYKLAQQRSPLKFASVEDIKNSKLLSPLAKELCLVLMSKGQKIRLLTKYKHRVRPEVFGHFDVNESLKRKPSIDYYISKWDLTKPNQIWNMLVANPRSYKFSVKEIKDRENFIMECQDKVANLSKTKYKHIAAKCVKQGTINYNAVFYLLKYMRTSGEFFHPKFKVDFDGQDFDFVWLPAFKSALVRKYVLEVA